MSEWKKVKIGDFLHRQKQSIQLNPDQEYALVTIRVKHKGVQLREMKKGAQIGSKMYQIKKGQFILSGIDARQGAFGIVPDELDGAIITNDFWAFDVDEKVVKRDFFYWLTTTPLFLDSCIKSSKGETQRIRLQKDDFYNFEFDFPPIEKQSQFLEHFKIIDSTSSALTNENINQQTYLTKLRQAILQEAIEGKLTADWRVKNPVEKGNPDFDAATLLATIKAEKQKLIAEGEIKKEKPLAPINADDVPFALPDGWVWVRLGDIVDLITKGSSPNWQGVQYVEKGTGIRFITSKNVDSYKLNLKIETFVHSKFNEVEPRSMLSYGDILTNIVGASIGRTAIYDLNDIANINQAVCLIRYQHNFVDKNFFLHFMNSPWLIKKMHEDEFSTGRANLSMTNIANFPFTLPPLAEQHAIVERVDRLLESVNALEQQVQERKTYAEQLMQAVLKEAFAG